MTVPEGQLKNWSVQQVQNWFTSMRSVFGPQATKIMVDVTNAQNITGSDLYLMKSAADVLRTFNVSPAAFGEMYCQKIKERKKVDIRNKVVRHTPAPTVTAPRASTFTLNFNWQGKRQTLRDPVSNTITVATMKRLFETELIGPTAQNRTVLTFICLGRVMQPNSTLAQCGIRSNRNLITVRHDAVGGTFAGAKDIYRDRTVNTEEFPHLKRSTEKDCITLEGDEAGMERVLMPCGHAICPETMFMYIESIFNKCESSVRIVCPVDKCDTEWEWQLCTEVADMTMDEYGDWTTVRDRRLNALRDEKECPHCHALCKRQKGVVIYRMNCPQCSNDDWCWECGKVWNHSGNMLCGNSECNVLTTLNTELSKCPTIKEAIADGTRKSKCTYPFLLECPTIRACPKCLTVVHHTSECKHMKCIGCYSHFCFYCMAIMDRNTGWPCGSFSDICKSGLHARQKYT